MIYIETARLRLRDWEEADLLPFQQMNANRQVRRYFPSLLSYARTQRDYEAMRDILETEGIGLFAVELKATGEWIGFIGITYMPAGVISELTDEPFYEIGWRLIPDVWGNGLATEGARAVMTYAYEQKHIDTLYSLTAAVNKPSRRVMEKLGMTQYDTFELSTVNDYHKLKAQVCYRWKA